MVSIIEVLDAHRVNPQAVCAAKLVAGTRNHTGAVQLMVVGRSEGPLTYFVTAKDLDCDDETLVALPKEGRRDLEMALVEAGMVLINAEYGWGDGHPARVGITVG